MNKEMRTIAHYLWGILFIALGAISVVGFGLYKLISLII